MLRGALRLAVGTVSLATGGWVLRALHGTPAALGAPPSEIRGVAERSPHFHDGVFVNLEPASLNVSPDQGRSLLWEIITGLEDALIGRDLQRHAGELREPAVQWRL